MCVQHPPHPPGFLAPEGRHLCVLVYSGTSAEFPKTQYLFQLWIEIDMHQIRCAVSKFRSFSKLCFPLAFPEERRELLQSTARSAQRSTPTAATMPPKKFGLIKMQGFAKGVGVKKSAKLKPKPNLLARPSVFGNADDEEDSRTTTGGIDVGSVNASLVLQGKKTEKAMAAATADAMAEDPNAFEYDSLYEQMHEERDEKAKAKKATFDPSAGNDHCHEAVLLQLARARDGPACRSSPARTRIRFQARTRTRRRPLHTPPATANPEAPTTPTTHPTTHPTPTPRPRAQGVAVHCVSQECGRDPQGRRRACVPDEAQEGG